MASCRLRHALTALLLALPGSLKCFAQPANAEITFVRTAHELQKAAADGVKHIVITEHIDFTSTDDQLDDAESPNDASVVPSNTTHSISVRIRSPNTHARGWEFHIRCRCTSARSISASYPSDSLPLFECIRVSVAVLQFECPVPELVRLLIAPRLREQSVELPIAELSSM